MTAADSVTFASGTTAHCFSFMGQTLTHARV